MQKRGWGTQEKKSLTKKRESREMSRRSNARQETQQEVE